MPIGRTIAATAELLDVRPSDIYALLRSGRVDRDCCDRIGRTLLLPDLLIGAVVVPALRERGKLPAAPRRRRRPARK